jgi:predicted Rossmann fold nucleotide-binding protein DprA/Smf involved in DNA uptake
VLEALRAGAADADEITRRTGLRAADVAATLVELELAGMASGADGLFRAAL